MRDRPDLVDDIIVATVRASYTIALDGLTFLPIGNDSATWVFRARAANGVDYFLKLRKGSANPASFHVPRYLHNHGVTCVIAALPTVTGGLWVKVDEFTLALYPFIDGATGTDTGMTEHHWVAYGATLRRIHDITSPPEITRNMRHEAFIPDPGGVIRRLDAQIADNEFAEPWERELAAFWRDRRAEIVSLIDRAEFLGQRLRTSNPPLVLCHADIHTSNILIDTADQLWIVDWDETVLAPKECDLMFIAGGIGGNIVGPREQAWAFTGYGPTCVDPLALAYYRHVRAVEDIGSSAERVFLMPERGEETRSAAVREVMSYFRPGQIVELAGEADRGLAQG